MGKRAAVLAALAVASAAALCIPHRAEAASPDTVIKQRVLRFDSSGTWNWDAVPSADAGYHQTDKKKCVHPGTNAKCQAYVGCDPDQKDSSHKLYITNKADRSNGVVHDSGYSKFMRCFVSDGFPSLDTEAERKAAMTSEAGNLYVEISEMSNIGGRNVASAWTCDNDDWHRAHPGNSKDGMCYNRYNYIKCDEGDSVIYLYYQNHQYWHGCISGDQDGSEGDVETLTAQHEIYTYEIDKYTVKYDAAGGSGAPADQTFKYNNPQALSATKPKKAGYIFKGWSTTDGGTSADYVAGQSLTIEGTWNNKTIADGDTCKLYAVWAPEVATILYHANGGSAANGYKEIGGIAYNADGRTRVASVVRASDTNWVAPPVLTYFGKLGYQSTAWSTTPIPTEASIIPCTLGGTDPLPIKNLIKSGQTEITLYAVWAPIRYKIQFDPNGGDGTMHDLDMTYDQRRNLPRNKFTKAGFVFDKWAFSPWSDPLRTFDDGEAVINLAARDNATITLFARWRPIQYFVQYDPGTAPSSSWSSSHPNPETFTYNEWHPLSPNGYSYPYHHFLHWRCSSDDESSNQQTYEALARVRNLTATDGYTVKMTAKWELNKYIVRFNPNGGSGSMPYQEMDCNSTKKLHKNQFTRQGFEFLGWSTSRNAETPMYGDEEAVRNLAGKDRDNDSITLYAVWKQLFKVAYIGNGQTEGADFIDAGPDGKGYSQLGDYTFDSNSDDGSQDRDAHHFKRTETRKVYTDSESGEQVEQKMEGTVVGWSQLSDLTAKEMERKPHYSFGQKESGANVVKDARTLGVLTEGAPNANYGKSPAGALQNVSGHDGFLYVNLSAVWDMGPVIEAYDRYYTIQQAQSGFITEEELLSAAKATDEELTSASNPEGLLKHGDDGAKGTTFEIWDYRSEDFTNLSGPAVVSETYRAKDSSGNVTKKMVMVHIIDPNGTVVDGVDLGQYPEDPKGRFISKKYLNTLGDDSIWVTNPEYRSALQDATSYKRVNPETSASIPVFGNRFSVEIPGTGTWNKKPQSVWKFTNEQRKQAKEYVNTHGWRDYQEDGALRGFLQRFSSCRTVP